MAFVTLKTIVFKKTLVNSAFLFFYYVYSLPRFGNYRSHMTFLASREGGIVQNL